MAIADATASLVGSNELLEKMNFRLGILRENTEEEIVPLLRSIDKRFQEFFKELGFQKLEETDKDDPIRPEAEQEAEGGGGGGLAEFFATLGQKLVYFVGVVLPAILASLGLANLGFTGKELDMLKGVKNFFSGGWWAQQGEKIANFLRNNKAIVALREFFGEGGKGGKIAAFVDDALKPFKAFGGKLLTVFGKIFYPISLIMSAFDGLSVASNTFEETGGNIASGFVGFVGGFVASFIGTFLDLIKDGVSWLLGKIFGEDNPVSKAFDDFSFADIMLDITEFIALKIDEMWEAFKAGITLLFSDPAAALKAAFTGEQSESDIEFQNKLEARNAELREEYKRKEAERAAARNAPAMVDASSRTTNNTNNNSTLNLGSTAQASNPNAGRSRTRGNG